MSDESTVTPEKKEETVVAPQFMTKADIEQMLAAQSAQNLAMFQRLIETVTPAKVETPSKKESFYDSPEKAAEALFDAKMKPLKDSYLANETQRQLAEISSLPLAGEYMTEIQAVMNSVPAEIRMSAGYAREVYNLVMGRHLPEVAQKLKEIESRKPEFTETVTAGAPASTKSRSQLSAEEKAAADGMGIPHEDYKKWRDNPAEMAASIQKKG